MPSKRENPALLNGYFSIPLPAVETPSVFRVVVRENPGDDEGSKETTSAFLIRLYQQEAEWLLRQRLTTDAIQAAESAIALGLKNQSTETLRIRAYAFDAYPDDFQTIEDGDFYKSDAIPSGRIAGNLYLPEQGDLWVYKPDSNSWARLNLPDAHYSLWIAGEDLFASFGERADNNERRRGEGAGLYRINTRDETAELLFSTHRRPPVRPLDSIVCERPFCVFPGEDGGPIIGLLNKPWNSFRKLGNGDEWKTIDPKRLSNITSVSGETLFIDAFPGEGRNVLRSMQRVDRRGHFEVLLWNAENPAPFASQPVWKFPDELLKATQTYGSDRYNYRAAMSGDDLYLFICERDGSPSGAPRNDLYIFRRGQPEVKMLSLTFDLSQADEQLIRESYSRIETFKYPLPSNYGFLAVDSGLVIVGARLGFWFIPFEDIKSAIREPQ